MGNTSLNIDPLLQQPILPKPKGCCDQVSLFINKGKSDPCDITCSICFRIFSNPRVMKCKHIYCEDCIREWGKGSVASCPYCRVEIKKQRGTFGRADKRTENKIDKIEFKCRNCCWQGSYLLFLTTFDLQPYLDDASLPSQNGKCDENEFHEHHIKEEKSEKIEVERTATKQQQKQEQKQEKQEIKLQQNLMNNKQTSRAFDLFISTLFQLARNGSLDVSSIEKELFSRRNI